MRSQSSWYVHQASAALSTILTEPQWVSSYIMIIAGNRASFRMFEDAWERVMRSPTGWHDRTPVRPSRANEYELTDLADW